MKKILTSSIVILSVFFLGGCSIGKYDGLTAEEWADEANSCEYKLDDYRTALEEANDNIEEANSIIEDAQNYAGESYEDMEWALYDLSTVDTVSEPY